LGGGSEFMEKKGRQGKEKRTRLPSKKKQLLTHCSAHRGPIVDTGISCEIVKD